MQSYRAIDQALLSVRVHDGIRAVYDRRSGQTHILAPDAAAIFDAIAERPGNAADVVSTLSAVHDVVADEGSDVLVRVDERLAELADMALVDPVR